MHLSVARLCLDCQEIHEEDRCPVCTSEVFGFITRWVKVEATPRATQEKERVLTSTKLEEYRQILNPTPRRSPAGQWLRKGSLVVAAGVLARWGWQMAQQNRVPRRERPVDDRDASTAVKDGGS
jgi:hypothetical protein